MLRYEAFNQNKLIEKYKTLIVLPEQTIWFNENFVSEDETSIFSKGKLFLYLFDTLFRQVILKLGIMLFLRKTLSQLVVCTRGYHIMMNL